MLLSIEGEEIKKELHISSLLLTGRSDDAFTLDGKDGPWNKSVIFFLTSMGLSPAREIASRFSSDKHQEENISHISRVWFL